jgi:hypothetical protein
MRSATSPQSGWSVPLQAVPGASRSGTTITSTPTPLQALKAITNTRLTHSYHDEDSSIFFTKNFWPHEILRHYLHRTLH